MNLLQQALNFLETMKPLLATGQMPERLDRSDDGAEFITRSVLIKFFVLIRRPDLARKELVEIDTSALDRVGFFNLSACWGIVCEMELSADDSRVFRSKLGDISVEAAIELSVASKLVLGAETTDTNIDQHDGKLYYEAERRWKKLLRNPGGKLVRWLRGLDVMGESELVVRVKEAILLTDEIGSIPEPCEVTEQEFYEIRNSFESGVFQPGNPIWSSTTSKWGQLSAVYARLHRGDVAAAKCYMGTMRHSLHGDLDFMVADADTAILFAMHCRSPNRGRSIKGAREAANTVMLDSRIDRSQSDRITKLAYSIRKRPSSSAKRSRKIRAELASSKDLDALQRYYLYQIGELSLARAVLLRSKDRGEWNPSMTSVTSLVYAALSLDHFPIARFASEQARQLDKTHLEARLAYAYTRIEGLLWRHSSNRPDSRRRLRRNARRAIDDVLEDSEVPDHRKIHLREFGLSTIEASKRSVPAGKEDSDENRKMMVKSCLKNGDRAEAFDILCGLYFASSNSRPNSWVITQVLSLGIELDDSSVVETVLSENARKVSTHLVKRARAFLTRKYDEGRYRSLPVRRSPVLQNIGAYTPVDAMAGSGTVGFSSASRKRKDKD